MRETLVPETQETKMKHRTRTETTLIRPEEVQNTTPTLNSKFKCGVYGFFFANGVIVTAALANDCITADKVGDGEIASAACASSPEC